MWGSQETEESHDLFYFFGLDKGGHFISQNWRGRPLISRETVVNLIAATTTRTGLQIQAMLDNNVYQKGIKITKQRVDEECNIIKHDFRGEWNYNILPNNSSKK